ncbi:MAG: hypothetical protein EOP85_13700 [Verrucomicrobiaceae bacterium]|nr:MAG: hypothetical protein EOP85_13700 [Verrucomicrobiaceae bacterium]
MTYRRLFHRLLLASVLALFGAWWFSLRTESGISAVVQPVHCNITLANAVIDFSYYSPTMWKTDRISCTLDEPGPFPYQPLKALIRFRHVRHSDYFGSEGSTLTIPIWVPWLLFNMAAFLFCFLMEKRSRSGKEKELTSNPITAP